MSLLEAKMRGSSALDSVALLLELSVVLTEEESMVRMPELTRDKSMVKVSLAVLPLAGMPTSTLLLGMEPPGTDEKREFRSKFVNWSPVAMLAPTTVAGEELMSSLLGVKVGMVSIWLRASVMEEKQMEVKCLWTLSKARDKRMSVHAS